MHQIKKLVDVELPLTGAFRPRKTRTELTNEMVPTLDKLDFISASEYKTSIKADICYTLRDIQVAISEIPPIRLKPRYIKKNRLDTEQGEVSEKQGLHLHTL